MKLVRLAPVCFALVLPLATACVEEVQPPATPPTGTDVPPPEPPPAPTDTSAAASPADSDGNSYVSGEYAIGADSDAYDDNDPAALTDFHGALDAHGTWTDDPRYGTVWVPASSEVGNDFVPYTTAGHWVVDDSDSYVWVSDYDWGWAPYHYGRWVWMDGGGWAWVPGRDYRGAWVEWGWDDGYGYVGWYPMAPAFFWFGGVAVAATFYVGPRWSYCGRGDVFAGNVGAHVLSGPAAARVAGSVHVAATPTVGPSPARMGYAATAVPHVSGAASAQVAHAQQFSRPSTATAMGASAPHAAGGVGGASAGGFAGRGAGTPMTGMPGQQQPQKKPAAKKKPTATEAAPRRGGFGGGRGGGGGGGHHR
jgi:hypothetical protein